MKLIELSTYKSVGKYSGQAMVDDADFEWLNQWNWCMKKSRNIFGY